MIQKKSYDFPKRGVSLRSAAPSVDTKLFWCRHCHVCRVRVFNAMGCEEEGLSGRNVTSGVSALPHRAGSHLHSSPDGNFAVRWFVVMGKCHAHGRVGSMTPSRRSQNVPFFSIYCAMGFESRRITARPGAGARKPCRAKNLSHISTRRLLLRA